MTGGEREGRPRRGAAAHDLPGRPRDAGEEDARKEDVREEAGARGARVGRAEPRAAAPQVRPEQQECEVGEEHEPRISADLRRVEHEHVRPGDDEHREEARRSPLARDGAGDGDRGDAREERRHAVAEPVPVRPSAPEPERVQVVVDLVVEAQEHVARPGDLARELERPDLVQPEIVPAPENSQRRPRRDDRENGERVRTGSIRSVCGHRVRILPGAGRYAARVSTSEPSSTSARPFAPPRRARSSSCWRRSSTCRRSPRASSGTTTPTSPRTRRSGRSPGCAHLALAARDAAVLPAGPHAASGSSTSSGGSTPRGYHAVNVALHALGARAAVARAAAARACPAPAGRRRSSRCIR